MPMKLLIKQYQFAENIIEYILIQEMSLCVQSVLAMINDEEISCGAKKV